MKKILALVNAPLAKDRLRRAVAYERSAGIDAQLVFTSNWDQLELAAREMLDGVAVIDPYYDGRLASQNLQRLLRTYPSVSLIIYTNSATHPVQDALQLAGMGIRHSLSLDVDDEPAVIQRALGLAASTSILRLHAILMEKLDSARYALVGPIVAEATQAPTPDAVAAILGVPRRQLERVLRMQGLPSPRRLVLWCRLMHLCALLSDPGRSVDSAAEVLGFSGASHLRRAFRRCTGLTPTELMSAGGLPHIVTLFISRGCRATPLS